MNYKNACLKLESVVKTNNNNNAKIKSKTNGQEEEEQKKERERIRFKCTKAVNTLYLRWAQYKTDYIALYGEDEYERMYLTPNYWVLPEDEDEHWESEEGSDDAYYSSS